MSRAASESNTWNFASGRRPDVTVIGGGVVGASVAFHLTSLGAATVVVTGRKPYGGGTGRSAAIVRVTCAYPELASASLRYFQEWPDRVGGRCGFVSCGVLVVAPLGQRSALEATAAEAGRHAHLPELVVPAAIEEVAPFYEAPRAAAVYESASGYASARLTTHSFLVAARRAGCSTVRVQVISLRALRSGWRVTTDRGRICTGAVVLAAGPWSAPIAKMAGITIPIWCERVQLLVLGAALQRELAIVDFDAGLLLRSHRRGVLAGAKSPRPEAVRADSYRRAMDAATPRYVARRLATRAPTLARSAFVFGFAAVYDNTPDRMPLIGEIDRRFFVACGFNGGGFKIAPAVGRALAELVARSRPPYALEPFLPHRPLPAALSGVPTAAFA
jgi:glycine/D-amino acid oxidase-like deaminating enzyme